MEIDYLRDFAVFAETMNYTAACNRLFISQPTLHAHIASLEKSIGAPLVEKRGAAESILTPAGRYLVGASQDLLRHFEELSEQCRSISEHTLALNVRSDTVFFRVVIDKALELMRKDDPLADIQLSICTAPADRDEALAKGAIDFDIGHYTMVVEQCADVRSCHPDILPGTFPQMKAKVRFWMTNECDLFDQKIIRPEDLQGRRLLYCADRNSHVVARQVCDAFAERGVTLHPEGRRLSSIYEHYMSSMGQAIGVATVHTEHAVGFAPPVQTRRAFDVEGIDLHFLLHTAYMEDALAPKKLQFMEYLKTVGASETQR